MKKKSIFGSMCVLFMCVCLMKIGGDIHEASGGTGGGKTARMSLNEGEVDVQLEDVFLLDLSFFPLWENGDYSKEDGTSYINKRRMRYPACIEREYDDYSIELSEDFGLNVFEYDGENKYIGYTSLKGGDIYVPQEQTKSFYVSLYRTYSENSLSYGQWSAIFESKIRVRISHGDVGAMEEAIGKAKLCKTSKAYTAEEELVRYLLDGDGETLASALWHNQIINDTYGLTGEDLNNGNLTVYFSSSEGDDGNSGLSPNFPKKSPEAYSGTSNINVLLKCGDTFKMTESFKVGNNCVIAAYGEGERPVLDYYREADFIFEKVEGCESVWVADLSNSEVCNGAVNKSNCNIGQLVVEGEVNWKRKVGSTEDNFQPISLEWTADGSWATDWNTSMLYLYSEKNPNDLTICYAPPLHAVAIDNVKNVVFRGIEITGAGMHGLSMKDVEDITISNCYIHHIGGSVLMSAGIRYGNAIQVWNGGCNVLASHNVADWIFDTCYTNQGNDTECVEENIVFTCNIGAHSFWGIETWGAGFSKNEFNNIKYTYNIICDIMDITNPEMPMYSDNTGKIVFAEKDPVTEDYVSYRCQKVPADGNNPDMGESTKKYIYGILNATKTVKEDYVTYRGGYTYHQMSSVTVSNSGLGEPTKIHHNVFWNTNRFLMLVSNDRLEEEFSCLQNNLFYGETDVEEPALFRYEEGDGPKNYLETPTGYVSESNRFKIWDGGQVGDNSAQIEELEKAMEMIAGVTDIGGLN